MYPIRTHAQRARCLVILSRVYAGCVCLPRPSGWVDRGRWLAVKTAGAAVHSRFRMLPAGVPEGQVGRALAPPLSPRVPHEVTGRQAESSRRPWTTGRRPCPAPPLPFVRLASVLGSFVLPAGTDGTAHQVHAAMAAHTQTLSLLDTDKIARSFHSYCAALVAVVARWRANDGQSGGATVLSVMSK